MSNATKSTSILIRSCETGEIVATGEGYYEAGLAVAKLPNGRYTISGYSAAFTVEDGCIVRSEAY